MEGNISGSSDLAPLDKQADMITEWFLSAKSVGLIYCSAEANSQYQVDVVLQPSQSAIMIWIIQQVRWQLRFFVMVKTFQRCLSSIQQPLPNIMQISAKH